MAMLHESKALIKCDNCTDNVNWYYYIFYDSGTHEKYCVSCGDNWYKQWKEN